jgi:hypothetical protein
MPKRVPSESLLTVAAFNSAIHAGCLHPSTRASQKCSSGSDLFVGVFVRSVMERHSRRDQMTLQGEGKSTGTKRDTNKGHENVPFWVLDGLSEIGTTLLE